MNVISRFPTDFVALNTKLAFIFAVNQNVAKFEILNGYHRSAVVQNILQASLARAQRLLCAPPTSDIPDETGEKTPAIPDVFSE
jgi:hypothetical protein